jgi:NADPH:quinone reductase-like Zn-dependent oxidoreductase
MKAYSIDGFGRAGSVREFDQPEPDEGQIRIRVAAAGLNPFDAAVVRGAMKDRMEHRFPLVPGSDASGTVEMVGPGVSGWSVGDEVFGSVGKMYLGEGTLAEFATMSAGTVARKPDSIDHPIAAAVPVAGVTALAMVDAIAPPEGDLVVALGATGGVGSYLVQLATNRGARVVAVCSGANVDYARALGAVDAIDYAAGDVADAVRDRYPEGIQALAQMARDPEMLASVTELVRSGGHVVSAVGGADAEALRARGVDGTNVMGSVTTAPLETLAGMLARGEIRGPELRSFPLDQAGEALSSVGSGHVRGKIVVLPG